MGADRLANNMIVEGLRRESPKDLAVLLGSAALGYPPSAARQPGRVRV
jgi:hypothetical protein